MLIGAMNHPARDVVSELVWMAEFGLEFVDLTIEPPGAASWRVDTGAIRSALDHFGLQAVGHTAFYLPIASPFEGVRRGAVQELRDCLRIFQQVGAKYMNIHPDRNIPMHDRAFVIRRNIESLMELREESEKTGVGLMIENLPGEYNTPAQLGELLDAVPDLALHLDIGHANLMVPHNMTEDILDVYGDRLRHVHLHDNKGGHADLHLPLGAGNIDVPRVLGALKRARYDGTITLEVFTEDRHYLAYSRDMLRRVWDSIPALEPIEELVSR